jgi:CpeT/CpcT family (DUF1001)
MTILPQLLTLADYLAGEFDNREQALADPAWYVHLRMWQRPIPLFAEDSLTIFAEQANVLKLDQPYRQRIMRLMAKEESDAPLQIQYYMPKDPSALRGAGRNSALLNTLTQEQLDLLPGCRLAVTQQQIAPNRYKFLAKPLDQTRCTFTYLGDTVEVSLGFETTGEEFLSYDKGIDQTNGKATWGAIMGPYRYTKRNQL